MIEKAQMAKRVLYAGRKEPNVYGQPAVQREIIRDAIDELNDEIHQLYMAYRMRKEIASQTIMSIMLESRRKQLRSLNNISAPIEDSTPLRGGAVTQ